MNYYIFLNSSSFEYIIVNYFIISLAILKDQPDFVHVSHVVDTHMSGLSMTEGRRPELIASNGAFHINKTHPYIFMLSPRCFFHWIFYALTHFEWFYLPTFIVMIISESSTDMTFFNNDSKFNERLEVLKWYYI